jgi:hypothetical protein
MRKLVELCPIGNEYIVVDCQTDYLYNFQGSYKRALKFCEKNNLVII